MAWVKVLSSVPRSPKFQKAGPAASWLWLCSLCYCQDGLTDGFIPAESIEYLGVKGARRLADALVRAGLWEAVPGGGWRLHDYLEHNLPAAEVRRRQNLRRELGEAGGRASGEARRSKQIGSTKREANDQPLASTKREANREAKSKQTVEANAKQTANPAVQAAVQVLNTNTAASPPFSLRTSTNPSVNSQTPTGDNFQVIAKLVRSAIEDGVPEADLVETIKVRASILGIDYGRISGAYDVITRAVASEMFKHTHPDLVR